MISIAHPDFRDELIKAAEVNPHLAAVKQEVRQLETSILYEGDPKTTPTGFLRSSAATICSTGLA